MNGYTERRFQRHRCSSREPAILVKPVVVQTAPAWRVATPGGVSLSSNEPMVQALLGGNKGVLGGGSTENQVARLSDSRQPIRQLQVLATEIGRVQGNRQLQRVMGRLQQNDGAQKYTLPSFSQLPLSLHSKTRSAAWRDLSVQTYTVGSGIAFHAGKYELGMTEGHRLLAHELTHVVQQRSLPAISGDIIQASFISWALKMGAKRVSKGMLKNFIKTRIKDRIKDLTIKKFTRQFVKEADDILDILEDPWWMTAIGFIPIAGDAFDLVRVPKQIKKAMNKADALEGRLKKILNIQGQWAEKLIPATLKRSESYCDELAKKSYAELVDMASSDSRAAKMKKLIEQQYRLMEKL